MNYFLTEDQKMMKDLARQVAREKMQPVREHYDETEEFPWEIVKEFARQGKRGNRRQCRQLFFIHKIFLL